MHPKNFSRGSIRQPLEILGVCEEPVDGTCVAAQGQVPDEIFLVVISDVKPRKDILKLLVEAIFFPLLDIVDTSLTQILKPQDVESVGFLVHELSMAFQVFEYSVEAVVKSSPGSVEESLPGFNDTVSALFHFHIEDVCDLTALPEDLVRLTVELQDIHVYCCEHLLEVWMVIQSSF